MNLVVGADREVLHADVLIETLDFRHRSVADLGTIVRGQIFDVEYRLDAIRAFATSSLDEECNWRALIEHSELGRSLGRSRVGEHTTALDDDLIHIGNHSASVAELVLLVEPIVDKLLVAFVVHSCAEVTRSEELALTNAVNLLHVKPGSVSLQLEFMSALVQPDREHQNRAWAIDAQAGSNLLPASTADKLLARPYSEDGAYSEVGVDDAAAIKRIESDREFAVGVQGDNVRLLL
mmetsp:Transcript_26749/g.46107  ORF Transcript_26749/g.46107 Transcript_26749/m.46107 type:complete len:236 (+) Transcript_26749:660-1367(+)